MANMESLLAARMSKSKQTSKMSQLAEQSVGGNLSGFAGVFNVVDLSSEEKSKLMLILEGYRETDREYRPEDLSHLISITSEIKAINNQAALLHGERIKKAQDILMHYREGAFTAWLINTYGNRQTPYNLLQYYEFCEAMPKLLRAKIETLPRQAVYVLASRKGSLEKKQEIIEKYQGESKDEMLRLIRSLFPLSISDRRRGELGDQVAKLLDRAAELLQTQEMSARDKRRIQNSLETFLSAFQ